MNEDFINEINQEINNLKQHLSKKKLNNNFRQLILDSLLLCGMCSSLNLDELIDEILSLNIQSEQFNLDSIYIENIKNIFLDDYDFHYRFSKLGSLLSKKLKQNTNLYGDENLSEFITRNESLELVKDFLNIYNPKMLKSLYDILNSKHCLFLDNADYCGCVFFFSKLKNQYLVINSKRNLIEPTTFIHEAGHIYTNLKYQNSSFNIKESYLMYCNYTEVFSRFLELLFYKFLKDNKLYKKDVIVLENNNYLRMINDLIDYEFLLKKDYVIKNKIETCQDLCKDSLGRVLSYHFYDMYLNDPEKTKYNMEQFIKNIVSMKPMEVLNNFGLSQEEVLSTKVLEKHIIR